MIRYLRYLFLALLAIALAVVAFANRQIVELHLLPLALNEPAGAIGVPVPLTINLPLFVVVFGGIAVGIMVGFVWEWFREHKHRAEAARRTKEAKVLAKEVVRLKDKEHEGKDEVLALLDGAAPRKAG